MMPHDDAQQDKDMIADVLQHIVDEMHSYESDRIMPESRKPKMVAAKIETASPMDTEMPDSDSELDPSVLKELLNKADEADDEGSLPEDHMSDLPPEILAAIEKRKQNPA